MKKAESPIGLRSKIALVVCVGCLFSLVLAFGETINRTGVRPQRSKGNDTSRPAAPGVAPSRLHELNSPLLMTQPNGQFDITQNVIAGGGDSSSAGQFGLESTLGEPLAGTVMAGGDFKQAGGFTYASSSGPLPEAVPTPTTPIVISEFRTRGLVGGANDEFIELYNTTAGSLNIGGWTIKSSNNAAGVSIKLTINPGTFIPAHGHFLATNSAGYSGSVAGDQTYSNGITDDGGIAVCDSGDVIIDQVGMSSGSALKEGTTLAPFTVTDSVDRSYERLPGGTGGSAQDTDDNFTDFQSNSPIGPQNLGSAATPPVSLPLIVISQVYGGGGNAGAVFNHDFIELFNRGLTPVDISGWSLQYASTNGSSWQVTPVCGGGCTLAPGEYYLVQEAAGAEGNPLPVPDVVGTINLAAAAGKVALVNSTTTLNGSCPSGGVVDFVGYGPGTNCFEGSGAAAATSAVASIFRNGLGCIDTSDNAADFTAAAVNPRNSSVLGDTCSASPTPTPTATPTPETCVVASVPAGLAGLSSASFTVPVNVSDTTGKGIVSFDFRLSYDPAVLTPPAIPFDQTGTLSSSFTITTNSSAPGQLVVSGFGVEPLNGAGTLLKLIFNVIGSAPSCSNLALSNFVFNEGQPCVTTANGDMCIANGTISGSISYGILTDTPRPVAGVNLAAAGSPNINTISENGGTYLLAGLGGGAYTVTPAKTTDVNGITSFDASLVAQHVVGLITLSANQQVAGDSSNNGEITSFDAALIAQTVVGLPNEGIAGTWKFIPASRDYPSTGADQADQNYEAILVGEVSGNWTPPGGSGLNVPDAAATAANVLASVPVSLPSGTDTPGATTIIPLIVGDVSGLNVISYQFDLTFDPDVIQPQAQTISGAGTLSSAMSLVSNAGTRGHLRVAAFGTVPLSGAGPLLNLRFTVVGNSGSATALRPENFAFNEGKPGASVTDGALAVQAAQTNVVQFSSASYNVVEDNTPVTITVNRLGDTSSSASVDYATADGTATSRGDYIATFGKLIFASGESSKSFIVLINKDSYVEGNETFNVVLSNPTGMSLGGPAITIVQITDNTTETGTNTIDDAQSYVWEHYHDFLNRQPDPSGLAFWTNEITACGTDQNCLQVKRINVSAAFYLSIEFQQTGYLVERLYKTAYGDALGTSRYNGTHQLGVPVVRLDEFLSDTQKISQGVIVGQNGWEAVLENNKQGFAEEFTQRSRFATALPLTLTPGQFVDKLNSNAGNPVAASERDQLVNDLATNLKTRAQVLRAVAENQNLVRAEFNRGFVLMQYFGYLRRNPNDPQDPDYTGYDFWLAKLNQFNGDFVNAEMVKAFITSGEYRGRFGPQ